MKYIPLFEEFINESLKAKKPNDIIEIDIDFAGSDSDLRKLSKKHKLEVDEYEPGMVLLKGKKKDILDYLQSYEYDMDPEDIKDLFPEILESDVMTIRINRIDESKISYDRINEFGGDFTKEYDGFIVLDVKDQKAYKFRYIKGTKGVKAEDEAIAKVMQKTGKPRNAFMVHGSIKKGEFDKTDTHPNFGPIKIEVL